MYTDWILAKFRSDSVYFRSNPGNNLLQQSPSPSITPYTSQYPGQLYTVDQQCKQINGASSYYCGVGLWDSFNCVVFNNVMCLELFIDFVGNSTCFSNVDNIIRWMKRDFPYENNDLSKILARSFYRLWSRLSCHVPVFFCKGFHSHVRWLEHSIHMKTRVYHQNSYNSHCLNIVDSCRS